MARGGQGVEIRALVSLRERSGRRPLLVGVERR